MIRTIIRMFVLIFVDCYMLIWEDDQEKRQKLWNLTWADYWKRAKGKGY